MFKIRLINEERAILTYIAAGLSQSLSYMDNLLQHHYTIPLGGEIIIDQGALKLKMETNWEYEVNGTWMNYTKKQQPEFVLAITKVRLL